MNDKDLKRYEAKLLDLRNRSREGINRMLDVVTVDAEAPGEHDHQVSESVTKELVLENAEESVHRAALAALARIESGTYGTCQQCGKKIAKTRLDAIPYAELCIRCERLIEEQPR